MFLYGHIIIKFLVYFNRAILGKNDDQVLTNQQIEKIRSRTVKKTRDHSNRVFTFTSRQNVLSQRLEIIWYKCVEKMLRGTEF